MADVDHFPLVVYETFFDILAVSEKALGLDVR